MKIKITPVAITLGLLGCTAVPAFAAPVDKDHKAQLISSLTQKTAELQLQINELQTELEELKAGSTKQGATTKRVTKSEAAETITPRKIRRKTWKQPPLWVQRQSKSMPAQPCAAQAPCPSSQAQGDNSNSGGNQSQLIEDTASNGQPPGDPVPLHLLDNIRLFLGGMPVVTSPYLGERSEFDGSDLISSIPSINEGLHLLQERQKIEDVYKKTCRELPNVPYVDLSGTVQPIAIISKPYTGATTSNIDLPSANFEIMGNINRWVTAFMVATYDNTPPAGLTPAAFGPTTANSRLFLEQGFVSVGNLNLSPFYGVMGQMYVPFGKYSSAMISAPLDQIIGRTRARAVLLGYDQPGTYNGIDAEVYVFRGDAIVSPTQNRINQGGGNIDYSFNGKKFNFNLGGGYIANIADALGMQVTGAGSGFAGFSIPLTGVDTEVLVHRVPGVDVHANFGFGSFSLVGEYLTATKDFAFENLTFDGHAAKPGAGHVEGVYQFKICDKPSNIAIGYQQSRQALAFLIPKRRYLATFNTSIWKDTIESIEFRHDINYSSGDTASGQGVSINTDNIGLGHSSNAVTFQFAVFF